MLYPKIEVTVDKIINLDEKLNYLTEIMNDVMVIVSMLLFKRFNIYGYEAELLDKSNEILFTTNTRFTSKTSGEDYIEDDNRNFNKYFTGDNISKLSISYRNLNKISKDNYLRIVNAYLTINELKIFEPMFRDAYHLLEAISKLITKSNMKTERLILLACNKCNIDLMKYNFASPIKSKDLKWLISEYRNELTHFNFDISLDNNILIIEFQKMLNLLRKLIIAYLDKSLIEFPYPKDAYRLNN